MLINKMNYKVHMHVRSTSNTIRPLVIVFHTGAGPNKIRTSFIGLNWCNCILPIHNMSLQIAFGIPVQIICKIMMFIQLGDLHGRLHLGVVDNLAVPLLVVASFIDRSVKVIFHIGHHMVFICSRPVANISEYTSLSDPWFCYRPTQT